MFPSLPGITGTCVCVLHNQGTSDYVVISTNGRNLKLIKSFEISELHDFSLHSK
jgi:hypothetical protein